MNISNITNYEPKDFAELLGVSVKTNVGIEVYEKERKFPVNLLKKVL